LVSLLLRLWVGGSKGESKGAESAVRVSQRCELRASVFGLRASHRLRSMPRATDAMRCEATTTQIADTRQRGFGGLISYLDLIG
jgi:hypothetical protein